MSDKTVEEILEFTKKKWDEADDLGHWGEANAFKMIQEYIESHRPELTPDEISQMKEKITNKPVTRREVDEEEINGE